MSIAVYDFIRAFYEDEYINKIGPMKLVASPRQIIPNGAPEVTEQWRKLVPDDKHTLNDILGFTLNLASGGVEPIFYAEEYLNKLVKIISDYTKETLLNLFKSTGSKTLLQLDIIRIAFGDKIPMKTETGEQYLNHYKRYISPGEIEKTRALASKSRERHTSNLRAACIAVIQEDLGKENLFQAALAMCTLAAPICDRRIESHISRITRAIQRAGDKPYHNIGSSLYEVYRTAYAAGAADATGIPTLKWCDACGLAADAAEADNNAARLARVATEVGEEEKIEARKVAEAAREAAIMKKIEATRALTIVFEKGSAGGAAAAAGAVAAPAAAAAHAVSGGSGGAGGGPSGGASGGAGKNGSSRIAKGGARRSRYIKRKQRSSTRRR